jgi:hypothetical protein
MKTLLSTACLLLVLSPQALAREHCELDTLQAAIRWCLVEAPEGIRGRDRMVEALQREGTDSDIFNYRVGFSDCYGADQERVQHFLRCRRADPMGLFNYGRGLIELPPIGEVGEPRSRFGRKPMTDG